MAEAKPAKKKIFSGLFSKNKDATEEGKSKDKSAVANGKKKSEKPESDKTKSAAPEIQISAPNHTDASSSHNNPSPETSGMEERRTNKKYVSFSQLIKEDPKPKKKEVQPNPKDQKPKSNLLALSSESTVDPRASTAEIIHRHKSLDQDETPSPAKGRNKTSKTAVAKSPNSKRRSPKKAHVSAEAIVETVTTNNAEPDANVTTIAGSSSGDDRSVREKPGDSSLYNETGNKDRSDTVEQRPQSPTPATGKAHIESNHNKPVLSEGKEQSAGKDPGVKANADEKPDKALTMPDSKGKDKSDKKVADKEAAGASGKDGEKTNKISSEKDSKPEAKAPEEKKGWFSNLFSKNSKPEDTKSEAPKVDDEKKDAKTDNTVKDTSKSPTPTSHKSPQPSPKSEKSHTEGSTIPKVTVDKSRIKDEKGSRTPRGSPKGKSAGRTPKTSPQPSLDGQQGIDKPPASKTKAQSKDEGTMEEQHLRAIWKELGVGQNGYLTVTELSAVCKHIGMNNMTDKELKELFASLDSDQDGLVSFAEFMKGLFQHAPTPTPAEKPPPKKHRQDNKPNTQSVIGGVAGMFSAVDYSGLGYARPSDVVDYWDKIGIHDGVQVFKQLQFDVRSSKLVLANLSEALEKEMLLDEGNIVHKAAVITCQNEIKYLRTFIEQLTNERDKYRGDLIEANRRVADLAQDGDETHKHIEREKQKEMESVEQKYEDEIRDLQHEMESLRDSQAAELAQQRRGMENVIIKLKEEETSLQDRIAELNSELQRLEIDLSETTDRLLDSEKLVARQQRELDSLAELHSKIVSELATVQDKKELRDTNDELIMEVESLRHQVASSKRRDKHDRNSNTELTNGDMVDGDGVMTNGHIDDDDSWEYHIHDKLRKDFDILKAKYDRVTNELQDRVNQGRRDYESAFRNEIAEIEENHRREKDKLFRDHRIENENLHNDFERQKADLDARVRRDLGEVHREEISRLVAKHEAEKRALEHKHIEEKNTTFAKLQEDHQEELKIRLEGLKTTLAKERNETSGQMTKERQNLEEQRKLIRDELSLMYSKETAAMRDRFNDEKTRMEELHKQEIQELQNQLEKGEEGLTGKLRDDFYNLLERSRSQIRQEEAANLMNRFLKEKEELREQHDLDSAQLKIRERQAFTEEKEEIVTKYKRQIAKLETDLQLDPSKKKLEEDYNKRVDELKRVFHDEIEELAESKRKLEATMADQGSSSAMVEQYRKKMEDLTRRNKQLEDELRRAEDKLSVLLAKNEEAIVAVHAEKAMVLQTSKNKEKLATGENESLKDRLRELSQTESRLHDEKHDLEKSCNDLRRRLDDYTNTVELRNIENTNLKNANERLTDAVQKANKNLDHQLQMNSDLKEQCRTLQAALSTTENRKQEAELHNEQLKRQLDESSEQCRILKDGLSRVETHKRITESEKEEAKKKLASRDVEFNLMKAKNQKLSDAVERIGSTLDVSQAEIRDKTLEILRLKDAFSTLEKELDELKWKYELRMRDIQEKIEQVDELKAKNDRLYQEKEDLEKSIMDVEDTVNTKDKELLVLKINNDKMTDLLNQAAKNLENKMKEMQAKSEETDRIKYDKDNLDKEHRETERRRDALQHRLDRTETEFKDLQNKYEMVTKEKKEIERDMKKRIEELKADGDEFKAEKDVVSQKFSHLDRELKAADYDNRDLKAKLDSMTSEKQGLQVLIEDLESQVQTLTREHEKIQSLHLSTNSGLEDTEFRLKQATDTAERFETENRKLREKREQLDNEVYEVGQENKQKQREIESLKHQCERAQRECGDLKKELEESSRKIESLQVTHTKLTTTVDQSMRNLEHEMKQSQAHAMEMDKLRYENKNLKREIDDLKHRSSSQISTTDRDMDRIQKRLLQAENRLEACEQEKNVLKQHLEHANEQLAELTTRLSRTESEHIRDLQDARDRVASSIDLNKYNETSIKLLEAERKIQDLETSLRMRSGESNRVLIDAQNEFSVAFQQAEEERKTLNKKLDVTKVMLKEKAEQLKKENDEARRASRLAEDLFKENAQLTQSLQVTKDKQKKLEKMNYELDQKCQALQRCLKKIVRNGEEVP